MPDARDWAQAGLEGLWLDARVTVRVESPRWSVVKRRDDGRVDFISPLPCPYNYGCIPTRRGGDGDLLDAVIMGPRRPRGAQLELPVVGVIGLVDAGLLDPKVICSDRPLGRRERAGLRVFFRVYARFKRGLYLARRTPDGAQTRSLGFIAMEG